jgi:UV DNA damage repair endonuclease
VRSQDINFGFFGSPYEGLQNSKRFKSGSLTEIYQNLLYCSDLGFKIYGINLTEFPLLYIDSSEIEDISYIIKDQNISLACFLDRRYAIGSQDPLVVLESKKRIENAHQFLTVIGSDAPIIIRVGGAYGNRKKTLDRFCSVLESLDPEARKRICVMNDEKPSLFSVKDLLTDVYYRTGTRIVVNTLYHFFNPGGLNLREAIYLSASTWGNTKSIMVHSESISYDKDGYPETSKISKEFHFRVPIFDLSLNVFLESTGKELSLLKYLKNKNSLGPFILNKTKESKG